MATPEQAKAAIEGAPKPKGIEDLIRASIKELQTALPAHLRGERLARIALTHIRVNPKLAKCSIESFLGALFTSAQIGVEPVAGLAYILPFNNSRKFIDPRTGKEEWRKVLEAQFIIGYRGIADLFYRHEKAVQLSWGVVHEGDEFDFEYGSAAFLKHRPNLSGTGRVTTYWVQATLASGGKPFLVMSADECLAHGREHSKTYDKKKKEFYEDSPWKTDPDAMCLKTVLIQLAKLLPLSMELQRAINVDESSRDFRKAVTEGLEAPSTTDWTQKQLPEPTGADAPPQFEEREPVPAAVSEKTGKPIEFGS